MTLQIFLLFCLAACSSVPEIPVSEDLARLEQSLRTAKARHPLALLAPQTLELAEIALSNAKSVLNHGGSADEVRDELQSASKKLNQAEEIATKAEEHLGPVLKAREVALRAGAAKLLPRELARVENELKTGARLWEASGDYGNSREISRLRQGFLSLKARAVAMSRRKPAPTPTPPVVSHPAPPPPAPSHHSLRWQIPAGVGLLLLAFLGGFQLGRRRNPKQTPPVAMKQTRHAA